MKRITNRNGGKKLYYFGRWAKTVDGKLERLPKDGWEDALAIYKAQAEDLHAGREPQVVKESQVTVAILCNEFLTFKEGRVKTGEITARTFHDYSKMTDLLVEFWGGKRIVDNLDRSDFEQLRMRLASQYGPTRLGNLVTWIRGVFLHNRKGDLLPREFEKPSRKVMSKHRAKSDKKLFSAEEIRWLLDGKTDDQGKVIAGADPHLRAMILLACNGGFGNTDIGELPFKAINLNRSNFLEFPRPKNGRQRRTPLWPETIEALRVSLESRPKPKDKEAEQKFFVTRCGHAWVRQQIHYRRSDDQKQVIDKIVPIDSVGLQFKKLMKRLDLNGHRGFYALRHTFATIGLQTGDRDAVKSLMGHAHHDVLAGYDETGPSDERLLKVTNFVRNWLFS